MTQYCKHHLKEPAHWECHNCCNYFCDKCIQKRIGGYDNSEKYYFCPSCATEVEWIAPSNVIKPFWKMLHTFFGYPARNKVTIIFLVCISFLEAIFVGKGLINSIVNIAAFILLMKYSFAAMSSTAEGSLIPPEVNLKSLSNNAGQAFVPIILIVIIVFVCAFIARTAGIFWGAFAGIAGFLCLPSMIMSYMAGGSILHSLNPAIFIGLIFRIGLPYLSMFFFLFLVLIAPNALVYTLGAILPEFGKKFLFFFANDYYTIIFYHLMGYVLLQFHKEIGYNVSQENFQYASNIKNSSITEDNNKTASILTKIEFFAKEGKYDEAINYIKKESGEEITDPFLSIQYFKLLKLKNTPELLKHLEPHLKLMINSNNKTEACEVFKICVEKKAKAGITTTLLLKLAGWLNEAGLYREAVLVYTQIISRKPESHLISMAYFKAACILHDKLDNQDKAIKILRMLKSKHPMDDIIPHVDLYLKKINTSF